MIKYICNAFSLNMLVAEAVEAGCRIHIQAVSLEHAAELAGSQGPVSAVGHVPTAAIFERQLGIPVPMNRATVALQAGDRVLVGQYSGPRLEEGTTELPEGAAIKWIVVSVQ